MGLGFRVSGEEEILVQKLGKEDRTLEGDTANLEGLVQGSKEQSMPTKDDTRSLEGFAWKAAMEVWGMEREHNGGLERQKVEAMEATPLADKINTSQV